MILKEYIKLLKELEKQHGNKDVMYATDDEGNAYHYIHYAPSVMLNEEMKEVICIN